MKNTIFSRVEQKYLLSENKYQLLMKKLSKYLNKDKYFKSTISSLYFDTDNFDLISTSIDKPIYKEKYRLRCYDIPKLTDNVFLEIKKKYKGIVNKRRQIITLNEFYNYIETGKLINNNQIMKELDYGFKKYDLKPKYIISYERYSYYAKKDSNLRITFDCDIRSRDYDLKLENGNYGKLLIDKKFYLMEIKSLNGLPIWLVQILTDLKIYPTSFSKYGNVFKNKLESDKNV